MTGCLSRVGTALPGWVCRLGGDGAGPVAVWVAAGFVVVVCGLLAWAWRQR